MGANVSEDAMTRVARSVTFISHVADRFESQIFTPILLLTQQGAMTVTYKKW